VRIAFYSSFRRSILVILTITTLVTGCKDDSSGPAEPTLTKFSIQEYHLSDSSYSPIDTQEVNTLFNIVIVARDQNNDTLKSYTGSVILTVNGDSSFLTDTTADFEDGWASELLVINDTGKFTITARQTGGSHTGTSNEFYVVPTTGLTQPAQTSQSIKRR
jgi:hypothetical protein